jgi:hypothetical protein
MKCKLCSKVVAGPIVMRSHMRHYHKERPFQCDFVENGSVCGKTFINHSRLQVHVNGVHKSMILYISIKV